MRHHFNMNLLKRINRELGANFDLTGFQHRAVYREDEGRIEMRLISQTAQTVSIGDQVFEFQAGEHITTEYSHKYTVDGFAKLAAKAGFSLKHQWSDPQEYFAILYFVGTLISWAHEIMFLKYKISSSFNFDLIKFFLLIISIKKPLPTFIGFVYSPISISFILFRISSDS